MSTVVLDKLFAAMRHGNGIPAQEAAVSAVLEALHDEQSKDRELVSHIVSDFALTQKVLQLANSPMYAPLGKDSGSVSAALRLLGRDAMLHLALSVTMVNQGDLYDDEGLSKTVLAAELARALCQERSEEASVATLMCDLGSLLLGRYLPEESAAIHDKVDGGMSQDQAANSVLGMSLKTMGSHAARRWNMPASATSLLDGTADQDLVKVVSFAVQASNCIYKGKTAELTALIDDLDMPGVDKEQLHTLVRKKMDEVNFFKMRPPAMFMQDMDLRSVYAEMSKKSWKSVEELSKAVFFALSEHLQTAHCLLFMMGGKGDFSVRCGLGADLPQIKSKLKLSGQYQPTMFHAVIQNNVDVSISDISKLKPTALPAGFVDLMPTVKQFVVLPIANHRVSGLLYCDWKSMDAIGQENLAVIRKMRNLFLPFFPD